MGDKRVKVLSASVLALSLLRLPAMAQHGEAGAGYFPPGYMGDTWTGEVTSTDDARREITLSYRKGQKTETFVGVLQDGYKVKMKDGSVRELKVSEIPPGTGMTVYYMAAERKEAEKKIKYYKIIELKFLPSQSSK